MPIGVKCHIVYSTCTWTKQYKISSPKFNFVYVLADGDMHAASIRMMIILCITSDEIIDISVHQNLAILVFHGVCLYLLGIACIMDIHIAIQADWIM